jgi:hypothetical protein
MEVTRLTASHTVRLRVPRLAVCKQKLVGVCGITDESRRYGLVNEILFVALQLVQNCPSRVRKERPRNVNTQDQVYSMLRRSPFGGGYFKTGIVCCLANTRTTLT